MLIITSFISFYTIVINFVLKLFITNLMKYDCALNVSDKFFKKILNILNPST